MLKIILIVVALLVIAAVVVIALQPSGFRVAHHNYFGACTGSVCASERFPQMGSMESMGENRSGDETKLRRRVRWDRRSLFVVRQ